MSRTYRAFLTFPDSVKVGDLLELGDEDSMHLARVLRVEKGHEIEILNGQGGIVRGKCIQVFHRAVKVEVLSFESASFITPRIHLGVAMPKGGKWDGLLRPLTEMGVYRMTPLLTERTEVRGGVDKFESKRKKWTKQVVEGCKQSGNPWLPKLGLPVSLADFIQEEAGRTQNLWLASLSTGAAGLSFSSTNQEITLLIGPEGGWTQEEEAAVKQAGGNLFSLGPYALRVENAAISALAVARQAYLS